MFICENCGAVFEEPIKGYEEEKDSCPNCGDWGFKEAKKCIACGEPSLDELCEDCVNLIKQAFNGLIDLYAKDLNVSRSIIEDIVEGCL